MPRVDKIFEAYLKIPVTAARQHEMFDNKRGIPYFLVNRWAKYMPQPDKSVFSWVEVNDPQRLHNEFHTNTKAAEAFRKEAGKLAEIIQQIASLHAKIQDSELTNDQSVDANKKIQYMQKQIQSLEKKAGVQSYKMHKARHEVMMDIIKIPSFEMAKSLETIADKAKTKLAYLYQHFDDQMSEVKENVRLLSELSKANPTDYSEELKENQEALKLLQNAREKLPKPEVGARQAAGDLLKIIEPLKANPRTKRVFESMSPPARALDKTLAATFLKENDAGLEKLRDRWSILYTNQSGSYKAHTDAGKLIAEMVQHYKDRVHLLTGSKQLEAKNSLTAWRKFQWEYEFALANSFAQDKSGLLNKQDPSLGNVYVFDKNQFKNHLKNIVTKLSANLDSNKAVDQNNLYPLETSKADVRRMQAMIKNVVNIVEKDNSKNVGIGVEFKNEFHIAPQDAEVLLNRHQIKKTVSDVVGHWKTLNAWIAQLKASHADPAFVQKMQMVASQIEVHVKTHGAIANSIQKTLRDTKFDEYITARNTASTKVSHLNQVLQQDEAIMSAIVTAIHKAPRSVDAFKKELDANLNKAFPNKDMIVSPGAFDIIKELRKGVPLAAPVNHAHDSVSSSSSALFSGAASKRVSTAAKADDLKSPLQHTMPDLRSKK